MWSTAYTLHLMPGYQTSDGQMSLNCIIKAGCVDVKLHGRGCDRLPTGKWSQSRAMCVA